MSRLLVRQDKIMPINDIFAAGGLIHRVVPRSISSRSSHRPDSRDPWDLVKIVNAIPGPEAFQLEKKGECLL
jgi:hypothetical protein